MEEREPVSTALLVLGGDGVERRCRRHPSPRSAAAAAAAAAARLSLPSLPPGPFSLPSEVCLRLG
jgi:hypothetical protein